jgi:hypothetical protein
MVFCKRWRTEMAGSRHSFKLSDSSRLVRAAIAAGLPAERLRLVHDLVGRTISVEVRDANTEAAEDDLQKLV